jgi:anthranilate phosphoribosyltransferase
MNETFLTCFEVRRLLLERRALRREKSGPENVLTIEFEVLEYLNSILLQELDENLITSVLDKLSARGLTRKEILAIVDAISQVPDLNSNQ